MRLVNLQTKQFEEVPDDQVQWAFQAGTHGFESPDAKVAIKAPDGSLGTVDAKDAASAFEQGASVAPHAEYRKADLEARHGGVLGTLAAAGEGAARGLTVGLSDPIAIKVAKMLGRGDEVRTHLAEEKEAHPFVSTAAEIAGAALPVLASGGAAAPEEAAALAARGGAEGAAAAGELASGGARAIEGAEALGKGTRALAEVAPAATEGTLPALAEAAGATSATGPSKMAQLLRVVGAPARAVSGAGELAGQAAERAIQIVTGSPAADSAMGRIARMAIKGGATGLAEGGLFGAGSEISENALGDHELNAEKMAAAIGHGALWGGMLGMAAGGGLTAAKETIGAILPKVAPHLERQANVWAVRAFNPTTQVMREAEGRAGGVAELGATARKFDIVPDSPAEAAKIGPQQLLERTAAAREQVGDQIGKIVEGSSATVKASEVLGPLDRRIAEMESTAAGKTAARSLKSFRDDLATSLGVPQPGEAPGILAQEAPKAERVQRTPQEIADYLRANPDTKFDKSGAPPEHVLFKSADAPAQAAAPTRAQPEMDPEVPVAQLIKERRSLQHTIFEDMKTLSPKWPVAEMRSFSGELNELEQRAIDGASHTMGAEQGKALREANQDYMRLKILMGAAETRVAKSTALRAVSPTSYLSGMAVAAGSIAHGNVLGALAGVGTALGHQVVLERGSATASAMLGKIAKLDLIARSVDSVDSKVDGAIAKFVSEPTRSTPVKIRLRHFASTPDENVQDRAQKVRDQAASSSAPMLGPEHVERALPGFTAHAPKTSQALAAVVGKAATYASQQAPQDMAPPSLLSQKPRPSDEAASAYLRKMGAVEDPVGTFVRGLETGKIHWDEIAAIRETKPKFYAEVQNKILDEVTTHRDAMTYDKVLVLSKIVGIALDPSLTAESVARYQQTYAKDNAAQAGPSQPDAAKTPKRQITGFSSDATLSEGQIDAS